MRATPSEKMIATAGRRAAATEWRSRGVQDVKAGVDAVESAVVSCDHAVWNEDRWRRVKRGILVRGHDVGKAEISGSAAAAPVDEAGWQPYCILRLPGHPGLRCGPTPRSVVRFVWVAVRLCLSWWITFKWIGWAWWCDLTA